MAEPSKKSKDIPPFLVMEVLDEAKQIEREGKDVIHLEIGEPDFDTPLPIKEAAIKALHENETHYTPSLGLVELRETIAEYYGDKYGVDVAPDRIVVTSGTSPAMLLIFSALLNTGDSVLMSNPYYACYPNFIKYCGGNPVMVNTPEENGFRFDLDDIGNLLNSNTANIKAILINSPSNPTGTLIPPEDLEVLSRMGVTIVSDEIYHGLVYDGKEHSILEFTDNAFVINGFSKLFAMTGWRLGYAIVPPNMVRPIQKLQQNLFICAGSFVQRAAIAALHECAPHVEHMVETYNKRRLFIISRLKQIGFGIATDPAGAFYVLANAKKFTGDSYQFAQKILKDINVAVTPGIDFGSNAEGYIRFSYANSTENIALAMDRLEDYLKS